MPKARQPMGESPKAPEQTSQPPAAQAHRRAEVADRVMATGSRIAKRPSRRSLAITGGVGLAGLALVGALNHVGGAEKPATVAPETTPQPTASAPNKLYCGNTENDMQEFKAENNTFTVKILAGCVTDPTILRRTPDSRAPAAPGAGKPIPNETKVEVQCRAEGGPIINNEGHESTTWLSVNVVDTNKAGFVNLAQLGRAPGLPEATLKQIVECEGYGADVPPTEEITPTPGDPSATPPIVRD
jgi:hypothetical protein